MKEDAATSGPRAVLVFDGECGFCTGSVLWLLDRLRRPVDPLPWQTLAERGQLEELGLTEAETQRFAFWVEDGRRWRGHRAAGRALRACGAAWPLAGALLLAPPPFSWLWALGYRVVARFRRYLPGVVPACRREEWPPSQS